MIILQLAVLVVALWFYYLFGTSRDFGISLFVWAPIAIVGYFASIYANKATVYFVNLGISWPHYLKWLAILSTVALVIGWLFPTQELLEGGIESKQKYYAMRREIPDPPSVETELRYIRQTLDELKNS